MMSKHRKLTLELFCPVLLETIVFQCLHAYILVVIEMLMDADMITQIV